MKSIIQLVIAAVLANAAFQTANSYYGFYDFKAKLGSLVHHGALTTTSELHQRVIDLGTEYGQDLKWDNVHVRIEGQETVVDFSYVDDVPFIPTYYYRHWPYEGSVRAVRLRPLKDDDRR
jgi:hypothetical protein